MPEPTYAELLALLVEARSAIEAQLKFNRITADPICHTVLRKLKQLKKCSNVDPAPQSSPV